MKKIQESFIDYPHLILAPDVWEKSDSTYVLKKDVEDLILASLKLFLERENLNLPLPKNTLFPSWIKKLVIISSIATIFYTEKTDVDVKILVSYNEFRLTFPQYKDFTYEQLQLELTKKLRQFIKGNNIATTTGRPIDFYFYETESIEAHFLTTADSVYDILERKWIKEFGDENPIDKLLEMRNKSEELASSWGRSFDLDLGELRRYVIEFIEISKFIDSMKGQVDENLIKMREHFRRTIYDLMKSISVNREMIIDIRHKRFKSEFIPIPEKYLFTPSWTPENGAFKLLSRWNYLGTTGKIYEIFSSLTDWTDVNLDICNTIRDILKF